jgi:hypothetical protein
VATALTVICACFSLPGYAQGASAIAPLAIEHSLTAFPPASPQLVVSSILLLPDQSAAPQPEAVPPSSAAYGAPLPTGRAGAGGELADTGFHAIWLLPLAAGLVLLGVLFAVFASRKQRRDEEQLAEEQAELARQAAAAELADRAALSELEELEKLEHESAQKPSDLPSPPTGPHDLVHPIEPRGPAERVGPFVSLPDDRVGPVTGADSHEENGKRPDAQ